MQGRSLAQRYGLCHRPAGAGQLTGVRHRARRASARQGAAGRRPTVRGRPSLTRSGPWWARGLPVTHSLVAKRCCARQAVGRTGWRAAGAPLMTVKKILTGQRIPPCQCGR
jgi:hypothetical protein